MNKLWAIHDTMLVNQSTDVMTDVEELSISSYEVKFIFMNGIGCGVVCVAANGNESYHLNIVAATTL